MSNDLRLNSLERFQKNSARLVLEEHGHCEVPAGCGGVVLRWFNPKMMGFALHNENKIRLQYCETETKGARDWHAHRPDDPWSSGQNSQQLFGEVPREHPNRPMQYDEKPMVCVSWQAAEELCRQISTPQVTYRLPTEAEWEKAARGGRIQQRYSWGDEPPSNINCDCNHFGDFFILPPRSLPPNDYGLYGMCGGVCEWTSDRYDRLAYDATAPRIDDDQIQPKVLRGGSWSDCPEAVTVSFRFARGASYWRETETRRGNPNSWGHYTPTIGVRLFRFETDR